MNKKRSLTIISILLITLIGGFLRFYKITQNPPSLNGDEISIGYDAYSLLKTAHDQHGKFLPLTFESVGDYKNPLLIYLTVPSIKIFGLTDFAVKFPNALMGTISIPIFFLFILDIFKNKKIAFIGSFFLAISAWHIFYSRLAYETLTASLFVLLGIWFFIKMLDGKHIWAVASAFFFTLTMYTAPAPRLFVPVFVLVALIASYSKLKKNPSKLGIFVSTCIILGLPMVYATLFEGGGTRFNMVFITHDIEFSRYVLLKYFSSAADIPLLFFFWAKRYLSYFDTGFLFFNGLDATQPNPIGLGMLYLFDIPFLIMGIVSFIKNKIPHKELFTIWLFTGIFPDSLTNNQKHAGRLLHLFPILIILTTLGALEIYRLIKRIKRRSIKLAIVTIIGLVIIITLSHAFLIISADFPRDKGESIDEGWREAIAYVAKHQDDYKEIVFDPRRGIAAPDMISNPYLYVLFYTKYDPALYQSENKIIGAQGQPYYYHFSKYTFRYIDWHNDCKKKDTLFIGSSWSFPEDFAGVNVLDKIYLTNGSTAFYIATAGYCHF